MDSKLLTLAPVLVLTIVRAITTNEKIRIQIHINAFSRDALSPVFNGRRAATINRIDSGYSNVFFPFSAIYLMQ